MMSITSVKIYYINLRSTIDYIKPKWSKSTTPIASTRHLDSLPPETRTLQSTITVTPLPIRKNNRSRSLPVSDLPLPQNRRSPRHAAPLQLQRPAQAYPPLLFQSLRSLRGRRYCRLGHRQKITIVYSGTASVNSCLVVRERRRNKTSIRGRRRTDNSLGLAF